jgi:hypothetical protein
MKKKGLDVIKDKVVKMPESDIKKKLLKDIENKSKHEIVTK